MSFFSSVCVESGSHEGRLHRLYHLARMSQRITDSRLGDPCVGVGKKERRKRVGGRRESTKKERKVSPWMRWPRVGWRTVKRATDLGGLSRPMAHLLPSYGSSILPSYGASIAILWRIYCHLIWRIYCQLMALETNSGISRLTSFRVSSSPSGMLRRRTTVSS